MKKKGLFGTLQGIAQDAIDDLPSIVYGQAIQYYDGTVTVRTDEGTLENIRCVGTPVNGCSGVVIPVDGEHVYIPLEDSIYARFGFNQESASKFNFAVIKKETTNITYEEFWILSNAYYDYNLKRFVKIDGTHTSFGIQIQANGTYPGEAELGYSDNVGINIWRNPKKTDVTKDTTNYDYTDFDDLNHIGAKKRSDGTWVEFAISSGWNNSFMIDSYGGMTIGGAGFEVDGNGMFPFTRLTHSIITIGNNRYALVGILDNAYHGSSGCDSNNTYSWFTGLMTPLVDDTNKKDNKNASFVIMYNDTTYDSAHPNTIDNSKWHIVFEVNKDGPQS